MPPKRTREHLVRQANVNTTTLDPRVVAERTKNIWTNWKYVIFTEAGCPFMINTRQRSNYAETSIMSVTGDDNEQGKYGKSRARQIVSDKRNLKLLGSSPAATKKRSTMNIRSALLYPKNLATLIEESGIASLPASVPTYLTAQAPAPSYPPRLICSVCGYWGRYKCRKCALPYCDRNCETVHAETRCEKRVV
ncbi:hypothetical protein EV421DRAFT_1778440 [Armillaria borealis]|uniref:HIT-type domain-containing protein n=1 Tax=Armillaria borealis TaxID=47425 RepID=A0AA39JW82_9AGAR|nr:hypothetical protein EV421DRAFT_1778440 [Armillaria borealis]